MPLILGSIATLVAQELLVLPTINHWLRLKRMYMLWTRTQLFRSDILIYYYRILKIWPQKLWVVPTACSTIHELINFSFSCRKQQRCGTKQTMAMKSMKFLWRMESPERTRALNLWMHLWDRFIFRHTLVYSTTYICYIRQMEGITNAKPQHTWEFLGEASERSGEQLDGTGGPRDTHAPRRIWLPQKYGMCPNCRGGLGYIRASDVARLSSIPPHHFLTGDDRFIRYDIPITSLASFSAPRSLCHSLSLIFLCWLSPTSLKLICLIPPDDPPIPHRASQSTATFNRSRGIVSEWGSQWARGGALVTVTRYQTSQMVDDHTDGTWVRSLLSLKFSSIKSKTYIPSSLLSLAHHSRLPICTHLPSANEVQQAL